MEWRTARRTIAIDRPLVMGILNVTPDSFSDGGQSFSVEDALARAEQMVSAGADLIDVGGESTRPGSSRVTAEEEIERVIPVIRELSKRFHTPVSIDTTKHEVAAAAIDAGAEVMNDISGLRWDERIADVAGATGAGLILMHSRGSFQTMHSGLFADDVFDDVVSGLDRSIAVASNHAVAADHVALDVGKTFEQNLALIAKLDRIAARFADFPLLVGTSRKSFIGKILGGASADERLGGSIATAVISAQNGANILRVHDVRETVACLRTLAALQ
jgi:dihydropteroate synthase